MKLLLDTYVFLEVLRSDAKAKEAKETPHECWSQEQRRWTSGRSACFRRLDTAPHVLYFFFCANTRFSTSVKSCDLPTRRLLIIRSCGERNCVGTSPYVEAIRFFQLASNSRPLSPINTSMRAGGRPM